MRSLLQKMFLVRQKQVGSTCLVDPSMSSPYCLVTGERRWHVAIPLLVAAVALGILAALIKDHPKPAFGALLVAAVVWAPDAVIHCFKFAV